MSEPAEPAHSAHPTEPADAVEGWHPAAFVAAPVISALVTLVLAVSTLLPGVAFWDTGEFQTVGPVMGTAHPTGYPSYTLLGWLASVVLQPFGEPAFRMNLLAALLAALTAALCALVVGRMLRRPLLAAASGVVFGALPVSWRLATHADPHGLHVALAALVILLLVAWEARRGDRWLVAAAAICGIALGNHSLTLFLAPGIALFVLAVEPGILRRGRFVLLCAASFALAAALVYLELPLRAGPFRAPLVYGHPDTPAGFAYVVLGVQFLGGVSPLQDLGAKLADLAAFAVEQLGPLVVLVPAGLVAAVARRPRYVLLTLPPLVLTCWFAGSYVNAEIDRYYLVPAFIVVTWVAILLDWAIGALGRLGGSAALVPEFLAALLLVAPTIVAAPARSAEVDRSHDDGASRWLDATLPRFEPNAVVVSWWNFSTALWYAQICQGRRPDIRVIDDRTRLDDNLGDVNAVIDANLGRAPVYVIRRPEDLAGLESRYRLEFIDPSSWQPVALVLGRLGSGS